ncbi:ABC transporter substrate-binding protein [Hypericibacter terrae]|uniref:ABC transporter substrate-binding protein n=1 Tax=Hypericibacter terrae TaxID=2602015 RepID=A0A5J6MN79_9PROT|nr:ABC transporter substrate-binding protein [Hypericibacter terrae]QEX19038.1 ABC transporter substrate-binding protein [Hypericibacter terrae]
MFSLTRRILLQSAAAAMVLGLAAGSAKAEDTIKIGVLATLEGAFTVLGEDSMRGFELALQQHDGMAGGKKIVVVTGSSDASPDSAIAAARKLVEQDKVDILIGPLSGAEGLAVKDYAKTQPQVTFVNGTSAAQDTTLRNPAPNFFRFTTDGVQWQAGLGDYAYTNKGYKKVVTIAEDYDFPYSQVEGFMLDFCKAGGHVVNKFWVPIGTKDYSSIVSSIPDDIDAVYVALGGADAVNFLSQYQQAGGGKPMIGGSITVDQTILGSEGKRKDYLIGTPSAGPLADNWDDPRWHKFVADYQKAFPKGFPSPSLFAHGYYVETLAVLTALDKVKGDLSDNQKALREELSTMTLDTPTGMVHLDKNRNGVADIFLTEVSQGADGKLYNKVVRVIPQVPQTMGMDEAAFLAIGPATRDNPSCP